MATVVGNLTSFCAGHVRDKRSACAEADQSDFFSFSFLFQKMVRHQSINSQRVSSFFHRVNVCFVLSVWE